MALRGRRNVPFTPMPTCLVTGGAGFLGSHLCDELLRRGHRVICVDNLETGSLANIEHIRAPEFRFVQSRHHRAVLHRRARGLRLPRGVAGLADRLPAPAAAHAEGRLARHPPHARAGQAPPRALPALLDQRGLRRPGGPPAARGLLGQRQPDRPARRLRRGQALRRGADDGLPPPAGRRHRRSCGSSTPTGARMRPHDGRAIPTFLRQALSDRPITVFGDGSQTRSFSYVDDLVAGIIALAESGEHDPVNIGNPDEYTLLRAGRGGHRGHRLELGDRLRGAAHGRPEGAPARHHARPRRCWAGSPRSSLHDGLRRTIDQAGVDMLVGARAVGPCVVSNRATSVPLGR